MKLWFKKLGAHLLTLLLSPIKYVKAHFQVAAGRRNEPSAFGEGYFHVTLIPTLEVEGYGTPHTDIVVALTWWHWYASFRFEADAMLINHFAEFNDAATASAKAANDSDK